MRIITLAAALLLTGTIAAQTDTTFKPSGKLWGYVFGDYYYKMHNDSLNRGNTQYANMPTTANAFEFRRAYLGYDYNIAPKLSSEFLLAYEGQTTSDGSRTVFLKLANVRWKMCKNADLIIGQQATPAFPMLAEKIWGYRSIEKTIFDMRGGSKSNDVGLGIQGKFDNDGKYGYDLLVGNGTAQKLEGDIFKKFYGDVYAKFLDKKLVVDVYGDYERTKMIPNFHQYKQGMKFDVFYNTDPITVGFEMYMQTQHNYVGYADTSVTPVKTDTTDANVMGISVFARGQIIKGKLNAFARYDMYNPDTKYKNTLVYSMGAAPVTESFITAGLDYMPDKNLHIMPNIWYDAYNSRAKGVSHRTKSDNDMVLRLTFWYIFK